MIVVYSNLLDQTAKTPDARFYLRGLEMWHQKTWRLRSEYHCYSGTKISVGKSGKVHSYHVLIHFQHPLAPLSQEEVVSVDIFITDSRRLYRRLEIKNKGNFLSLRADFVADNSLEPKAENNGFARLSNSYEVPKESLERELQYHNKRLLSRQWARL